MAANAPRSNASASMEATPCFAILEGSGSVSGSLVLLCLQQLQTGNCKRCCTTLHSACRIEALFIARSNAGRSKAASRAVSSWAGHTIIAIQQSLRSMDWIFQVSTTTTSSIIRSVAISVYYSMYVLLVAIDYRCGTKSNAGTYARTKAAHPNAAVAIPGGLTHTTPHGAAAGGEEVLRR